MDAPPHHSRGGEAYVVYDHVTDSYHFVYTDSISQAYRSDTTTSDGIRDGIIRFYQLVNPPPWYRRYAFATVSDAATLVLYTVLEDDRILSQIQARGEGGIPRHTARAASSPPDEDRAFREERDGITIQRATANILRQLVGDAPVLIPPTNDPLTHALNTVRNRDYNPWVFGENGYGVHRPAPIHIPYTNTWNNIWNNIWNDFGDLPPLTPQQAQQHPQVQKPQKRVADIVISNAVREGGVCPITMEPIRADSAACVAPCYHVFEKSAIEHWMTQHTTCPQCRESCAL